MHFTNSTTELETYIPRSQIIKELGGDDPYEYTYIEPLTSPNENARVSDAAARDKLLAERATVVKEFEQATYEWISGKGEMRERRNEVAERLRKGYWVLDPYVRSRSLYDRLGIIGLGGEIEFYPEKRVEG